MIRILSSGSGRVAVPAVTRRERRMRARLAASSCNGRWTRVDRHRADGDFLVGGAAAELERPQNDGLWWSSRSSRIPNPNDAHRQVGVTGVVSRPRKTSVRKSLAFAENWTTESQGRLSARLPLAGDRSPPGGVGCAQRRHQRGRCVAVLRGWRRRGQPDGQRESHRPLGQGRCLFRAAQVRAPLLLVRRRHGAIPASTHGRVGHQDRRLRGCGGRQPGRSLLAVAVVVRIAQYVRKSDSGRRRSGAVGLSPPESFPIWLASVGNWTFRRWFTSVLSS